MKLVVALLVLIVGLGGIVYYTSTKGGDADTETGTPGGANVTPTAGSAPSANGVVMSAADWKLENYRGNVVVMDFWATWCGPCKMAMPGVQKLHEKFAKRPVRVFGMDCWERGGDPAAYMKNNNFNYGLVTGCDAIAQGYGVKGIPHFVVIGIKGEQLLSKSGYSPQNEEQLSQVIEDHLKKNNL